MKHTRPSLASEVFPAVLLVGGALAIPYLCQFAEMLSCLK